MSKVFLLDCTLRDGGYVNNWDFGEGDVFGIVNKLTDFGADIIEAGFLRNETYNKNRSVFSRPSDCEWLLPEKKGDTLYSLMIEAGDPEKLFPIENLLPFGQTNIDYIRICTWKRLTDVHLDFCKRIADLGYKISVQPTAVGQYSHDEFKSLCDKVNKLNPFALYVVDTWGTQSADMISDFVDIAENRLDGNIKIGYHGHNNKMQALGCAQTILNKNLSHDVCIDASVFGMGRGVGNLQTEVIADYLNERYGRKFDSGILTEIFEKYLKRHYLSSPWGYSLYHYLSSLYDCAPDFATYFKQKDIDLNTFEKFLKSLAPSEKVVFKESFVTDRLKHI